MFLKSSFYHGGAANLIIINIAKFDSCMKDKDEMDYIAIPLLFFKIYNLCFNSPLDSTHDWNKDAKSQILSISS